jgi:hypothetical protein
MKLVRRVRSIALVLGLFALAEIPGCASGRPAAQPLPNDSRLTVSGPPGTRFSADYRSAGRHDAIVSTLSKKTPSITVVQFREGDLDCDIRKIDASSTLTVSIYRDGKCLFLREAPPGVEGMRITHFWAGWKAEMY